MDPSKPPLQPVRSPGLPVPAPWDPWRALIDGAKTLRRLGEWRQADALFARAAVLRPDRLEPVLERARLKWTEGDVELAEDLLRQAVAAHPGEALPTVLLARLLVQRDAAAEAAQLIEASIAATSAPLDPLLLLAHGEVLLHRQDFAAAAARFSQAEAAGASRAAARAGLARVALAQGNARMQDGALDEAAFLFKRAIGLDPRWAEPLLRLAEALFCLGNPARAVALARQAGELEPRAPELQYRLGCLLRDAGRPRDAMAALEKALRGDPLHPMAGRALAGLLAGPEPARALLLYAGELTRTPADAQLWLNLAELCLRLHDRRQARRCLEEARRLCGDIPLPYLVRASSPRAAERNPPGDAVSKPSCQ